MAHRDSLTPAQRVIRARAAAYALHAQGGTSTAAGTAAFLSRFERQVENAAIARGETLTPEERARRAMFARMSYMTALALRASRAHSRRRSHPPDDAAA